MSINLEKSNICVKEVTYPGCIIDSHGIRHDIRELKKFEFVRPNTKKQLQRILGFVNYFRPFIKNLSSKLTTFNSKLKRNNKNIPWSGQDDQTLQDLKSSIINASILVHPDLQ